MYPDLRVSICCFTSVRNGTSIIVSSTLVASRESPASSQSLGKYWKTRDRFTQLAKLTIDRSADWLNSQLTYFFVFLFNENIIIVPVK